MYIQSRVKGIDSGYELCQLLSGVGGGADKVVNAATVEIRFEAVVLIEIGVRLNLQKKMGAVGSHFSTQGYAISLFAIVATE